MSGFGLASRILGESLTTLKAVFAKKGVHISDEGMEKAIGRYLKAPDKDLTARFAYNAQHDTYALAGGYKGRRTVLSPQKPLFNLSFEGERLTKPPEAIYDEIAWMLDSTARQSNPSVAHTGVKETSSLALAA